MAIAAGPVRTTFQYLYFRSRLIPGTSGIGHRIFLFNHRHSACVLDSRQRIYTRTGSSDGRTWSRIPSYGDTSRVRFSKWPPTGPLLRLCITVMCTSSSSFKNGRWGLCAPTNPAGRFHQGTVHVSLNSMLDGYQ